MSNLLKIGKLSYHGGSVVGKGQYGKIFQGQLEDAVDVSILRVDKSEILVDTKILRQTDTHPNTVRFYCVEEDGLEFQ